MSYPYVQNLDVLMGLTAGTRVTSALHSCWVVSMPPARTCSPSHPTVRLTSYRTLPWVLARLLLWPYWSRDGGQIWRYGGSSGNDVSGCSPVLARGGAATGRSGHLRRYL